MRKIISIFIVCAVAVSVMAVPARRDAMNFTQSDGSTITVYQHGDECFHYFTDARGNWLQQDEKGDFHAIEALSEEEIEVRRAASRYMAPQTRRVTAATQETGTDRLLAPRGAVILVSFSDVAFKQTNADMTQWAMGSSYTYNGATGSIHQYFMDQSWGQYDLEIDVYGPVKVSKGYAYYGKDVGGEGNDQHPDEMVVEACKLAHDSCGADFSQYDSDGDGKVDWVVILYAGKGQADGGTSNTIWPHQYELSYTNKAFKLDGKTVDHYCCLNEIDGQTNKRCAIGTFCHEFSHVMGLPDFYATNGASHRTMCDWDIMDYGPYNNGGNTPPNYSAYERWFMGWMTPTLVNKKANVVLPPLDTCRSAVLITETGGNITNILSPNPSVFYLLENRQKGGWDRYIAGSGLMITRVAWSRSKWLNNTVNNTKSSMGVDLLEAQANTSQFGKATDLYPAGATEWKDVSKYKVTRIEMENKIVTFKVNGGGNVTINVGGEEEKISKRGKKFILQGDPNVYFIRNGVIYDMSGRIVERK